MSRRPCSRCLIGLGVALLVIGVVLIHSIGPFLILAGLGALAAGLTATPAATSIVLNWTDPSDSSITKYQTRQRADDAAAWSAWADVSGSGATTATVSSLTTRKRYTVQLRAVNANGSGAASSATSGTSAVLVNNTSQTPGSNNVNINATDGAQAFTTGSKAGGYTLTSVVLAMSFGTTTPTAPVHNVYICEPSCSAPGSTCSSALTNTDSGGGLIVGANSYTVASGVSLKADTTYWIVFDSVSGGSNVIALWGTTSDNEDTDGLTDWSIADTRADRGRSGGAWNTMNNNALQVAVLGYLKTGPSAPTGLGASAGNGHLSLTWTNPSNAGINKYQVRISSDGGTTWSPDWTDISGSGASTTSHTVTGLQNGTTYTVEVRAVGDGGATPGSSARTTGTPTAANVTPPMVSSATVAANGTTLTVQLDETGHKGALGISDWSYTAGGVSGSITSGTLNASAGTITVTISPAVTQGQTVRLSYSGGQGTNRIRDASDNNLAAFSNRNAINNSTQQVQQQPPPDQQQPDSQGPTTPPPDPPNLARNPVA
ncbi:MAG: fibronectin type III domain-containing protein [Chloroflexi bacterium]|nr:fibronectin type III domain-containing protein [Chloroflexota bacterium]